MTLFSTRQYDLPTWPDSYRPLGEDTFEKEQFCEWWDRHSASLAHLPEQLCEQWIFRHWYNSPYNYIPLSTMRCNLLSIEISELFSSVYPALAGPLDPEHDYICFEDIPGFGRHRTAVDMDSGSWSYPIIVLNTPQGIKYSEPDNYMWRHLLIEGHSRYRYLHAKWKLGHKVSQMHEVFVVTSPIVKPYMD